MNHLFRSLLQAAMAHGRPWCVAACLALVSGAFGVAAPAGAGHAHAERLEGQFFEDTIRLGDRTLRLNGTGLRGVAWIKAFVAGLYLAAPTSEPGQAMAMPGPKRLRLKVMLEAPSHELSKSFVNGVRRNEPDATQAALAERVERFQGYMDSLGTLKVGDTLDVDFLPGRGSQLRLNDALVGAMLPGDDFYRAILKIFIGERPADPRLKEGLLRGGSAS